MQFEADCKTLVLINVHHATIQQLRRQVTCHACYSLTGRLARCRAQAELASATFLQCLACCVAVLVGFARPTKRIDKLVTSMTCRSRRAAAWPHARQWPHCCSTAPCWSRALPCRTQSATQIACSPCWLWGCPAATQNRRSLEHAWHRCGAVLLAV